MKRLALLALAAVLVGCAGSSSPTEPKLTAPTPAPTPAAPAAHAIVRGMVVSTTALGIPIPGASLSFLPGGIVDASTGSFVASLPVGQVIASASAPGYVSGTKVLIVTGDPNRDFFAIQLVTR